jgi:two-component system response regulator YesN
LNTEDTIYNEVYIAAQRIKISIEENTDFRLNIGIGKACADDLESCISYRQAIQALQNVQFIDCGGIIQIEEIKEQNVYVLPFDQEADLLSHLEKGYRDQAYLFIDNIFAEFEKKGTEINVIKDIIKELSFNIEKLVRQYDGLVQNLVQNDGFILDIIENLSSLQELKHWLKDLIEKVTEFIYCRKKAGIPAIITQIIDYIESHYFDCLNLGFIAEKFNISIAYLSRSFKSITGEKYIDYLNRIRMEKAAEKLLDYTDLKVKDIAEMVGFENPYYFMKRFKQYFHCTPTEYRKVQ